MDRSVMALDLPQLEITRGLLDALERDPDRPVEAFGLWGAAKTVAAAQAARAGGRPLLMVAPGRVEAEAIYEDLLTLTGESGAALLPAWEVLPSDVMEPSDDVVAERMNTLMRLLEAFRSGDCLYVAAPLGSLLQRVIPRSRLAEQARVLEVGAEHDLDALLTALIELGYERELMVEQRGQMSLRGGILDIFPISAELPYRIEFFGDEIESIRRFEPETQRSVDRVDRVRILPRSEKALVRAGADRPDGLAAVTDYFPDNTLVVFDEPAALDEAGERLDAQHADAPYYLTWDAAQGHLARFARMGLAQVAFRSDEAGAARARAATHSSAGWERDLEGFWKQLRAWDADGFRVRLLCGNSGERARLLELLDEQGYRPGEGDFALDVELGRIRGGFVAPEDRLAVLSEREIFGRRHVRRVRRRFEAGASVVSFDDLKAGDYIVHAVHGIGRYFGLKRFDGKAGDFLALQYASGDKLYLPVTHIDQIQKYTGGDGAAPKVDRLGGATWARTRARVKKAVRDMTDELLRLYATRAGREGHAFAPDTHWQAEFEDAFEYDETPDQARAIVDAKRDMESPRPMDRLLCGDVGFGKTEVAIRAAFKAVMGARQVAVLVPTTVLAEQHYLNFSERYADYPITVEMLSRFRTAKEMKRTIERLDSGEVDVVIGTHRLLSKDIRFKDLGLVVIDEEHRFGVAQKEKLKQLRNTVDVLSMTATPIPRSLNMALLNVRDMSVINTAPNDRLPIHTCIEAFDEGLIREAIRRELAREGQVFVVHNRVHSILAFAQMVQQLAPEARLAVGHGQMPERELEQVMTAFIRHEIDVLVCTTIIGSGIDIPNANTIIINDADRFGLSDLYQLRGRVGRYKHRAFAYLLVSGERALTEEAQKRLSALEEFSVLGSGFRIAMRDLEIRGCGNLLGAEQHGHIAAVGYDTYTQLVSEAVAELKGEPPPRAGTPPFDIAVDAYIPEAYVPSEAQKLTLYKRIAGVRSVGDLDELRAEIADRFGAPPGPVRRLLDIMRVRARAADAGLKRIAATKDTVTVEFDPERILDRKSRAALAHEFGPRLAFAWQEQPRATFRFDPAVENGLQAADKLVSALADL